MRKLLTVLLGALLLFGSAALALGAGEGEGAADAPLEIRWFGLRQIPEERTEVFTMVESWIERDLGRKVIILPEGVDADSEVTEKINLLLASGDMPDVFPVWWNEEVMKEGTARFELSDVQEYMPGAYQALVDVMKLVGLNEEGTWERFRRDGKLVQIPNVWFGGQFPHGIAWRMDVLEDLGFDDVPGTYDDIDAVFAAFKAKYENQSPYACPAKGLTWQCFPMIFDGTGWAQWRWNLRDGRLVRGFNQPEMKLGYEVARDWYEKGYIDPEFPTYDSGTNVNLFRNGQTIVKEWIGYGSWDDSLDRPGTEGNWIRKVVPEARIKMGAFPRFFDDVRPARYVWNPFHGGSYGFGRHLESRPDDLHLIMQIMDKMNTDEAYNTLTNLGIEGMHWETNEFGFPERKAEFIGIDAAKQIGAGYFWGALYSYTPHSANWQHPGVVQALQDFHMDPEGIYSDANIRRQPTTAFFPITDDNGDNLWGKLDVGSQENVLFVELITGAKDISAFDEWMARWAEGGDLRIVEDRMNEINLKFQ
jgi:putative aldouronate transport system substrate-binding protein